MSREETFRAIELTRPILKDDWEKHWSKVLKPEVIQAYILWLAERELKEKAPVEN